MASKKPAQFKRFEELTKQLLTVRKKELDEKMDEYNARNARRRARKGRSK
jgi:hypothetical protein